jgi:hypothetical protein
MAAWRSETDRKTPRLRRRLVSLPKKPSTALSQDAEVGVKWIPSGMPSEPLAHLGMLVGRVVVDNGVDRFALWNLRLNGVEEADELLVSMAPHIPADHAAVEDVEGGEQRGRAMTSSASPVGCDQAPGFGFSRRPREPRHGRGGRRRGRRCS